MRMMLRFTLPVEKSNAAINDGSLGRTMESVLSKLKPEAAYFAPLERIPVTFEHSRHGGRSSGILAG